MMAFIEPANDPDVHPEKGFPTEKEEKDKWLQVESDSDTSSLSCSTGQFSESSANRSASGWTDINESEEGDS